MKIGVVYTGKTPELEENIERELRKNLGQDTELISLADGKILEEVIAHGGVNAGAAARLAKLYMQAVEQGAEGILNVCSSVGDVADAAKGLMEYIGVPLVRIDERMCEEAVRGGSRIGILATLPTTLAPTRAAIERIAGRCGKELLIREGLFDAFGADRDRFLELLLQEGEKLQGQVDLIVLCQASMAYGEKALRERLGIPVLSSPALGAAHLKEVLEHC